MRLLKSTNHPYLIINLVFILFIGSLFIYFLVFSAEKDNYPVQCIYKQITGQSCETCGLSHSLSSLLHGDLQSAINYNRNGILIFTFFMLQLIMRIASIYFIIRFPLKEHLILFFDLFILFISFVYCFKHLIIYWFTSI